MDIYIMNISQKSYVNEKQIKIGEIRKTLYESFVNEIIRKINID